MQFLINHKPDIEQIFAIKIITNKNMFDAYIILIYVKIFVYKDTSYLYLPLILMEKNINLKTYYIFEMCIYENYVLCASSCSCY